MSVSLPGLGCPLFSPFFHPVYRSGFVSLVLFLVCVRPLILTLFVPHIGDDVPRWFRRLNFPNNVLNVGLPLFLVLCFLRLQLVALRAMSP